MTDQPLSNKQCQSADAKTDHGKTARRDKADAAVLLNPAVTNAMAINRVAKMKRPFQPAVLADALLDQIEKLNSGNLDQVEGMLLAQAHTLDHIFVSLAQRALDAPSLEQGEICMRLAFQAQRQARANLESISALKNPGSIAYVRQTNIGGAVQVNNGQSSGAGFSAGKNQRNELLEPTSEQQRLDNGTAGAAGFVDTHLAPVGTINRP